ncbi:hypothetical protein DVH24_007170 [Malus domestica]|uniref:Uncharacterized protein n=1 Tax=Malus domestica TaxID=3750 RepID=A0A498HHW7_MALDO|nr:hypothetical protein DVH24_007170 [Malus domestica]
MNGLLQILVEIACSCRHSSVQRRNHGEREEESVVKASKSRLRSPSVSLEFGRGFSRTCRGFCRVICSPEFGDFGGGMGAWLFFSGFKLRQFGERDFVSVKLGSVSRQVSQD